jgi:hypothetical protein
MRGSKGPVVRKAAVEHVRDLDPQLALRGLQRPALAFESLIEDDVHARRAEHDQPQGNADPVSARCDRALAL